jgi:D-alanine-D-alanine ligase-like ATP-grasp enzyme
MKSFHKWKPEVSVLIPYAVENGARVSPLYDTPAFRAELDTWFGPLGLKWQWQPVTLDTADDVVAALATKSETITLVAFNLCDGDEFGGYPGISVIGPLEKNRIAFTGSDSAFYKISTSKVEMKTCFRAAGVPTADFVRITDAAKDLPRVADSIGYPFIVKPDVSAASFGIGLKSLVRNRRSVAAQVDYVLNGDYREFFEVSGLFAERFISGPEFTALVVADGRAPEGLRAYPVAERVFHSALPAEERFLSYDRYWAFHEEEAPPPSGEPFYAYKIADQKLQDRLSEIARNAFRSVQGKGYGRVDMRMDEAGQVYVLEVNANCGLSSDLDSSIGRILNLCEQPIHTLIEEILRDAYERSVSRRRPRRQKRARMPRVVKPATDIRERKSA